MILIFGGIQLDIFLKLGIIIIAGIIGGRVANLLKLPNVSGYIVAGLLVGPSFFNFVKTTEVSQLNIINDMALGAIAFSVGSEFLIKEMKKMGKNVMIITVAEVIGAIAIVFSVMFFIFKQSFEFSIVIASMSAATAPAGIIMVIRELKAKGPLIKTILPIVAIDDALGIIAFGLAISIAKITSGGEVISIFKMISVPLFEILGSLLLGLVIGFILSFVSKKAKGRDELLTMIIGFILATTGMANYLGLSAILTCMMMGATLVNLMQNSNRVFSLINEFTPPIYLLFFTVAGAGIDIGVLSKVGILGIGYILARASGKIIGATLGAQYVKSEPAVIKNLGMSLLTQGGVSIGLSAIVRRELPQFSTEIVTVILFSVLIFEIMGPILAKVAITNAGEVNGEVRAKTSKSIVTE